MYIFFSYFLTLLKKNQIGNNLLCGTWQGFSQKIWGGGGDLLSGTIFQSPSGTESDEGAHVRDKVRLGGT